MLTHRWRSFSETSSSSLRVCSLLHWGTEHHRVTCQGTHSQLSCPAHIRSHTGWRADDLLPPDHAILPVSKSISSKGNHELGTPILNLETVIPTYIKSNVLVLKSHKFWKVKTADKYRTSINNQWTKANSIATTCLKKMVYFWCL